MDAAPTSARGLIALASACAAGAFVGFAELQSTEVTPTVGCIVLFAFVLGMAWRRRFWISGILVGGAVPAAYAFAAIAHIRPREVPQPEAALTYVTVGAFTLAVGLVSSAIGAFIVRAATTSRPGTSPPRSRA